MKSAFAVCFVLGCGGGGKPTSARPVAPATPVAAKPAALPAPDCPAAARALVHEHGFGKVPAEKQAAAQIAAEAEVIAACLDDQWSAATIACAATRAAPSSCLGQLSEYQEQSFRAHLSDWETNWARGADRRADEQAHVDPEHDPTPGELPTPQDPAQEEWISCSESLGDVATYEPQLVVSAADRAYAVAVRAGVLRRSCETHWANPVKKCLGAARDAAGVASCRATLEVRTKNAIVNAIADADAKFARVAAVAKNARAIDCKAVAAAHYSDDLLRNHLGSIDPAERARVFAESKQVLARACTVEKWSATTRACIVTAPPNEYELEECFGKESRLTFRFGVPARGVFFKTGIAECDAMGDTIKKLVACDKLDDRMKSMILESYSMQVMMFLDAPGRSQLDIVKRCKETQTTYAEAARERGCAL